MNRDEQAAVLKYLLGQIDRAESRKKQLDERLKIINERRRSPIGGKGYGVMPRNEQKKEDGAASILFRIADIEERIYEQKREIEKATVRVMDIIDYLPVNTLEREICELRHIDLKPPGEIAKEIPMSRSQVNRKYNTAIDMLLANQRIKRMVVKYEDEYLAWKVSRGINDSDRSVKNR